MSTSLAYRADIDGLRAVAVLLVLLFHAGIDTVGGGFVGVDVFFVLTGFLITSILFKEAQGGSIDFGRFYLRRFRRLLPALITVLVATVAASAWILLPDDFVALVDSVRFAMGSLGNVWFWLNAGGYFDADIHELPLLHTWSLGVEEQFYLLWPALILLGHRTLSRRGWSVALGGLVLVGLLYSQWAAVRSPSAAYFLLPGRAFEILIGAVVAREIERLPTGWRRGRGTLAVAGLALIVAPSLLLTGASTFPGWNALWPCLGTALLIVTGSGGHSTVVNRALAWKPLVAIGLLSYSIYLWHWPIIALLNYQGVELTGWVQAAVLVVPIALAALSYFAVERPFRFGIKLSFAPTFALLVAAPLLLSLIGYEVTERQRGFPGRMAAEAETLRRDDAKAETGGCTYDRDLSQLANCKLGLRGDDIDGVMVGDSYAGMYARFLDQLARDAGLSLRHRWYSTSPPVQGAAVGTRLDPEQLAYIEGRNELLDDHGLAVLISAWGNYRYGPEVKSRLWNADGIDVSAEADDLQLALITDLVNKGVKVVLIDRPPAPPKKTKMKELRARVARGKDVSDVRIPLLPRSEDYILDRVRRMHSEVVIIEPFEVLCDAESCAAAIDGQLLYRDDGTHLTRFGAQALGELYLSRRPNPLEGLRPAAD